MSERMMINVASEQELKEKFVKACRIIMKMRIYRKRWEADHGADAKKTMKHWDEQADEFIASLSISPEVD
jgi:hypothetical protein